MTDQIKPKVQCTTNGLLSWACDCGKSGILAQQTLPDAYQKAYNHARQYHGHSDYIDGGGGWWVHVCPACHTNYYHFGLEHTLNKADQHYRRHHHE